jgi:hypothetical protein
VIPDDACNQAGDANCCEFNDDPIDD